MVTGKSCCVSDSDDPLISEAESLQFLFLLCGDLQDVFFLAPIGGGSCFVAFVACRAARAKTARPQGTTRATGRRRTTKINNNNNHNNNANDNKQQ